MKVNALVLFLFFSISYAQNKDEAEKLVIQGIDLHDKGNYAGAIELYNKALDADKDNLLALSEKAMSLSSSTKYDEAIAVSKYTITAHPNEDVKNVYVSYANALDHLKKGDEALKIYDEGIKRFPNYYQLQYNKGICYTNLAKYSEAIACFQKAVLINPKHASSLNAIGALEAENNRIPAILAFSRFFIIEPQTSRSKKNFEIIQSLLMKGVTKTGENDITLNIGSDVLSASNKKKNEKENDFSITDLTLSMDAALDFDEKNVNKTDVEKFIRKFETICASLDEVKKNNYGFYWENFVPYFIEMKNQKLIEPFAYIVFVDSETEDVSKWHKNNQGELDKFYNWSKKYNWAH
jgi:tetratricopeptide (TPR) repeat protein